MNWSQADLDAYTSRQVSAARAHVKRGTTPTQSPPPVKEKAVAGKSGAKSGGPNKTELEYSRMLQCEFPGAEIVFEGLKIKLNSGHVYSPDWVVRTKTGNVICCETKQRGSNGFRQASYGRSKLAFDCARIEWPMFSWRWCEKHNGQWHEQKF